MLCVASIFCLCRYSLEPPSNSEVEKYVDKVFDEVYSKEIDKKKILVKFSEKFGDVAKEMPIPNKWRYACCIVAKKLV